MKPELRRVGESQSPVVVLDGFSEAVGDIVGIAAAMAPFEASRGTYYPGLRRIITPADGAANAYVEHMLEAAAPFIGGAFDFDRFDLLEASFSMVTAQPDALTAVQRAPHFDSTDPGYLALLHYLADTPGTAFYRQRSTGIEIVDDGNVDRFVGAARAESVAMAGYIRQSDTYFEQTGVIEGRADRLVIYRGNMLHSGIIPEDMDFSSDPRRGRLTANIFILGH
ncbi:hypothetical protein IAG41_07760 [Sphingomonas sp. JC676]|uniref:DUF6445 family protein n=1 Tax=Sphingomonas sp. JC676 TaxID=2768065 RepID=UPI0016580CB2|nr:DUF6445 family protein [Sphingomonas sp. JC676]MBC9032283.1 hypothetical protein [Sphingomonas sp. JC676]